MKITEIFDVQNSNNNLILGQNTYILIDDYEDCNNRLHDHSTTLELLTQRALNLSLFKTPQKLKIAKPSYHTKNEKLKQTSKIKIHGITSGELMVIKKLLMVNLRSFKIMQKLFRENKELQILLNDSRVFAKKQKQKIEYVQNENESLKKTETHLKKRLESFLRQVNRASKSFIAGFKDDNSDSEDSSNSDVKKSQKLELAFNLSTNVAYRLHDDANKFIKFNNFYQELSFSSDIAVPAIRIRLAPEIVELPSNNFLKSFDRPIEYPLLLWQNKKLIEDIDEISDLKEPHPKVTECPYKIEKDVQNAIRLHSVNSSVWKSFVLMKTIKEFMIFNQVCELIKAFLIAGEACESEETCSEIDQTTFVQFERSNPRSCDSASISTCTSLSTLTLTELTDEIPDEKDEKRKKKLLPKIKVFYSLKKIHKKFINCASKNKKSRRNLSDEQSRSLRRNSISIGVGDSFVASVDRESQFDNSLYVEFTLETDRNESSFNTKNDEVEEKDSGVKTLSSTRKDFRKSLKSLENIIKSCKRKSELEESNSQRDKLRKMPSNNEKKYVYPTYVNVQRKAEIKEKNERSKKPKKQVKEVEKKKRYSLDSFYKRETRKMSELPEMRKMYQIILENRLSQGVSFEYLNPDQSKVQLLFVSKSPDADMI